MLYRCIALVLCCSLAAAVAWAGPDTIPDIARRSAPNPVYSPRTTDIVPTEVDSLISEADLIVRGTVAQGRTYLSSDQRSLFTEYMVTPQQVILQRNVQAASKPGQPTPITLIRWGGSMTVEGVPVTLVDEGVPRLIPGNEYVLFLKQDTELKEVFRDVNSVTGTWAVSSGRLELPATAHAYGQSFKRFRQLSVDRLESEVRRDTSR